MAAQDTLKNAQQRAALLEAAFAQIADTEIDMLARPADEARHYPEQHILLAFVFVGIAPHRAGRPVLREHIRMRQRLVKALPPANRADIQPELHISGTVAHQEGV